MPSCHSEPVAFNVLGGLNLSVQAPRQLTEKDVERHEITDPVARETGLYPSLRALNLLGKAVLHGTASFTTSGTTKTIDVSSLSSVEAAIVTAITDVVALSCTVTINSGTLTVTRASGGTSGASFSYFIIGVPA